MRLSSLSTASAISSDIFKLSIISHDGSAQLHEQANIAFKTTRSRVLLARLEVKNCFADPQLPNNFEMDSLEGDVSGEITLPDHRRWSKV